MRRHWYITIVYVCRVENCRSILHTKRKRVYGRWPPKEKIIEQVVECYKHGPRSYAEAIDKEIDRIRPNIENILTSEGLLFWRLK